MAECCGVGPREAALAAGGLLNATDGVKSVVHVPTHRPTIYSPTPRTVCKNRRTGSRTGVCGRHENRVRAYSSSWHSRSCTSLLLLRNHPPSDSRQRTCRTLYLPCILPFLPFQHLLTLFLSFSLYLSLPLAREHTHTSTHTGRLHQHGRLPRPPGHHFPFGGARVR